MIGSERRRAISELAQMLEISPDLIRQALWMLETKRGYKVWSIAKKLGGERQIQKALWPLNEVQARLTARIYPHAISEINHSFIAGRSHFTAVLPHLQSKAMFCWDIKDAFPSTKKNMVVSSFRTIGFNEYLADLMAELICYSSTGRHPPAGQPANGFLPQGYVSSPTVFNLILKNTDRILAGFARKKGYQVSRYADNFAISTTEKEIPKEERRLALKIVESFSYGHFKIPEEKTSYWEAKGGKVHFEFLGLVIEGPEEGERSIGVADEKLAEYEWTIHETMAKADFSERKFREIKGKINYLKTIYRDRPLPARVRELYAQYRQMREIIKAAERGQLFFPI